MIFSHSSARARWWTTRATFPTRSSPGCPKNGGVVMVTFVHGLRLGGTCASAEEAQDSASPSSPRRVADTAERAPPRSTPGMRPIPLPRATLAQVADHIEHVRQIAGVDHVGIGSDFDGIGRGPDGAGGCLDLPGALRRADPPRLERCRPQEARRRESDSRPAAGGGHRRPPATGASRFDGHDPPAGRDALSVPGVGEAALSARSYVFRNPMMLPTTSAVTANENHWIA